MAAASWTDRVALWFNFDIVSHICDSTRTTHTYELSFFAIHAVYVMHKLVCIVLTLCSPVMCSPSRNTLIRLGKWVKVSSRALGSHDPCRTACGTSAFDGDILSQGWSETASCLHDSSTSCV
jgi:hypothetical protein